MTTAHCNAGQTPGGNVISRPTSSSGPCPPGYAATQGAGFSYHNATQVVGSTENVYGCYGVVPRDFSCVFTVYKCEAYDAKHCSGS